MQEYFLSLDVIKVFDCTFRGHAHLNLVLNKNITVLDGKRLKLFFAENVSILYAHRHIVQ